MERDLVAATGGVRPHSGECSYGLVIRYRAYVKTSATTCREP